MPSAEEINRRIDALLDSRVSEGLLDEARRISGDLEQLRRGLEHSLILDIPIKVETFLPILTMLEDSLNNVLGPAGIIRENDRIALLEKAEDLALSLHQGDIRTALDQAKSLQNLWNTLFHRRITQFDPRLSNE